MAYELNVEENGFVIRLSGKTSVDEIAEANDALLEYPIWGEHQYQIWSFIDAWALDGEARESRVISKVDTMSLERTHDSPIKIAFISTNSKTNEFIMAYIDSVDKNAVIGKIFRTEADARTWLAS